MQQQQQLLPSAATLNTAEISRYSGHSTRSTWILRASRFNRVQLVSALQNTISSTIFNTTLPTRLLQAIQTTKDAVDEQNKPQIRSAAMVLTSSRSVLSQAYSPNEGSLVRASTDAAAGLEDSTSTRTFSLELTVRKREGSREYEVVWMTPSAIRSRKGPHNSKGTESLFEPNNEQPRRLSNACHR